MNRLKKSGLDVKQQHPVLVRDEDGSILGEFYADLLVENILVVELKAAKALAEEHTAQLLGYLKSTGLEHGLLINFGSYKFQIKKYIKNDQPSVSITELMSVFLFQLFVISVFFVANLNEFFA